MPGLEYLLMTAACLSSDMDNMKEKTLNHMVIQSSNVFYVPSLDDIESWVCWIIMFCWTHELKQMKG